MSAPCGYVRWVDVYPAAARAPTVAPRPLAAVCTAAAIGQAAQHGAAGVLSVPLVFAVFAAVVKLVQAVHDSSDLHEQLVDAGW